MNEIGGQPFSISILGFPASGKTTFLAALWELVQEDRIKKTLSFQSIGDADQSYLQKIVRIWRGATEQGRTELTGISSVRMNLRDDANQVVRVVMPDAPGEEFLSMWEDRQMSTALKNALGRGNILLLIHGNKIKAPAWITERQELRKAAKSKNTADQDSPAEPQEWHPRFAPTQVQLIDLLQQMAHIQGGSPARKVALMISAWDKVEGERLEPHSFLTAKLPMLSQYLAAGRDGWNYRVYGVSAQGGEYDTNDPAKAKPKVGKDAARLRDVDIAATRIRLVSEKTETNDLTEPLQWLMK